MKIKNEDQKSPLKKLLTFDSEDEEREFWATHSALDFFDFEKGVVTTFPNLTRSPKLEQQSQQETQG